MLVFCSLAIKSAAAQAAAFLPYHLSCLTPEMHQQFQHSCSEPGRDNCSLSRCTFFPSSSISRIFVVTPQTSSRRHRHAMLRLASEWLSLLILIACSLRPLADNIIPQAVQWSSKSYGPDGPWHDVTVSIGAPAQAVDLLPGGEWSYMF
jgi:hypothetical protein